MHNPTLARTLRMVALATTLVVAFSLVGCRGQDNEAKLRLQDDEVGSSATQAAQTATGSVDSTSTDPKAADPAAKPGAKSGNSSSGSSGSSSGGSASSGSSSGGTSSGGSGSTSTATSGMKVRIMFWNDTNSKSLQGAEVLYGTSSYKPNTKSASGTGVIGPCPYSKKLTLVVYPDGRDGKKIEVPFIVTKAMEAASERDAIHVSISDDKVRVLGNAIDNFDQTFSRF